jgi:hypothetical protein
VKFLENGKVPAFKQVTVPVMVLGHYFAVAPHGSLAWVSSLKRQQLKQNGSVLELAHGSQLYLVTNYTVVDNPSLLASLPADLMVGLVFDRLPIDDDTLKYVEPMRSLEALDFRSSDVSDAGLKIVGKLSKLRELTAARCNITGPGLWELAKLPKLGILNLTKNPVSDWSAIANLVHLQALEARRTGLRDSDLVNVGRLSGLVNLVVSDNHVTAKGIASLYGLKKLEVLRVSQTDVTPKDVSAFKPFKSLKLLEVGGKGFNSTAQALWRKELPHVTIFCSGEVEPEIPVEVFRPLH